MLYGKWRPRAFGEIVGQDHITVTLRNALASGQVAHAYLFTGPRGTGKTTTARILGKAVNCLEPNGGEPCNRCRSCEAINRGAALDLIEMDAASNRGIDDVRDLREKIGFAPSDLKKKIYLLDEAHMLTGAAFNALLKTLEEPPPHAIFILATTEFQQMPATIASRCQRFDFRRIPNEAIVARLAHICSEEGYTIPRDGLLAAAIQSRGGLRDAINLVEQIVAQCGTAPSTEEVEGALGLLHDERASQLASSLVAADLAAALTLVRDVADDGIDLPRFAKATTDILREAMLEALGVPARGPIPRRAISIPASSVRQLAAAIEALANADLKRDPADPVPLELACATAILGAPSAAAPTTVPAAAAASVGPRERAPASRGSRPTPPAPDVPLGPGDQFLKSLYNNTRLVNTSVAACLNGSCEVVSMADGEVELGFYFPFHLKKVETDGRTLLEQEAERILGKPVRLKLSQVQRPTTARKAPRGGHLVSAARGLEGATPVGKDE